MNKTIKFTVSIIFIILIIAGAYLWYSNREIRGSMQDYEIKSYLGETVVENKKAGFSFKAPSGWEAGIVDEPESSAIFVLPETEDFWGNKGLDIKTFSLAKGCLIESTVSYNKQESLDDIKIELEDNYRGFEGNTLEIAEINGREYLRSYWEAPYLGVGETAISKSNDNVYSFALYYPIDADEDQKNQCISDFDEFLETIVIE